MYRDTSSIGRLNINNMILDINWYYILGIVLFVYPYIWLENLVALSNSHKKRVLFRFKSFFRFNIQFEKLYFVQECFLCFEKKKKRKETHYEMRFYI